MNRKASISVIILAILVAVMLALAGGGFYLFQKEHNKALQLQSQLDEINSRLKATETNLDESKNKISDLQTKLEEEKIQRESLDNDLQQEKSGRQEALAKIEQLRVDVDEQKKARLDLEQKLNLAQDEARKTQEQLKNLETKKTELETKLGEIEAKAKDVELGKIVVTPAGEATPAVAPTKADKKKAKKAAAKQPVKAATTAAIAKSTAGQGLEGKVLVVNKEYNFVVMNLGSRDGVTAGSEFSIYHNNQHVGDVKIEKVHDAMSAAGFLAPETKDKVSEGDRVVQKVK